MGHRLFNFGYWTLAAAAVAAMVVLAAVGHEPWVRYGVIAALAAGIATLIIQARRREQKLQRAEQRLRDAVEAIPGGFMLFDAGDRLVHINRNDSALPPVGTSFARIGDTFETILRRTIAAGRIPEAVADPDAWVAARLRRHKTEAGNTLLRVGGRVVEVIERPTQEGGVVTLRFDVTERERVFEAERLARAAADAANRAKSDFLSRMSHELRTPLNAIIGFAQILRRDRHGSLTPDQKEHSELILRSGQHLLNLVNEVLDLSGIEAGRLNLSPERVAVADVVSLAVATMKPVAAKVGVTLVSDGGSAGDVRADLQRLRQVLLNLLSNAIKYNRPKGRVTINAIASGTARVRISVSDTGIGVAPEHEAQLFEPFQRLGAEHSTVEGVGIGLALSKKLVEAMGGEIGYATTPGEGSTFWVDLPTETSTAAPDTITPLPEAALAKAGGYSVLYVEDNPTNLRLMEHVLRELPGVALFTAPSGTLGIELAVAQRPDIIVLDLNLPGMDGYEVLKRLKTLPETRETPVIALTAAAMPADIGRGLDAGFFNYLTKPLDVPVFLASLDAALADTQAQRTSGTVRL